MTLTKRLGEAESEIELIQGKFKNLQLYSKVIRLQLNDKCEILQNHISEEKDKREHLLTRYEKSQMKNVDFESEIKLL